MQTTTSNMSVEDLAAQQQRLAQYAKKYEIKKARLKDIFLSVEFSETLPDSTNTVKKDCTAPVHDDLKDAFKRMDNILRAVCEQPAESNVSCNGFSIGGDAAGATLIGYRDLDSGKVLNLTGPYEKFEDNAEMENAIEAAKTEILLYLFEGKHAPEEQLSLFGDGSEDEFENGEDL